MSAEYNNNLIYQYNNEGIANKLPVVMKALLILLIWIEDNCFDKDGKFDIPLLKLWTLRKKIKEFINSI